MSNRIHVASFCPPSGVGEFFCSGSSGRGRDFASEAAALLDDYQAALAQCGCPESSGMLLRFHLSDPANQTPLLRRMLGERTGLVSIVGQPPADGSRIALEAWHLASPGPAYRFKWSGFDGGGEGSSYEQMQREFQALEAELRSAGGSVAAHTQRTWLYCRDVDNNYAGLVRARNDFFAGCGLTANTHFIASTGIGGDLPDPHDLVHMDALSYFGLQPGQVQYLHAADHLSPTALYNVSFERGTRIKFGDRSHVFISGTASIDHLGKVLHPGDVAAQARRMIENIAALLAEGESTLADGKLATVYLRDAADADVVAAVLDELLPPELPRIILKAPVCRPAWLVETELLAVSPEGDPSFPAL